MIISDIMKAGEFNMNYSEWEGGNFFFFFFPENISFKHMSSIGLWSNLESNAYLFLHVARNSVFSTDTFSLFLKPKTGSSVLVNK